MIHHPGAEAAVTDSPCGEHCTAWIGIAKLILVRTIQLYFLPTIPNRKLVSLHVSNCTETETSIPGSNKKEI